ncbi:MAG: DUF501 domain-containing protein [Candidatus Aquicultor secundus]|uniref:DUF501 domain-containing protein n=1 Tax=Candidatus Aquicultor secundus TaxID=1973895 RepID=UPI000CBE6DAE|nr:DUF501 domain-containing protein [Candidatus Aquicultor secundus]NCO65543.1 DUF501 domain-containing protein [Solirubrobacter sp.]PIW21915.1 MAG: DUF501 domain-containing protein [Candidatus Aquicultor secundus]PIX53110.1 MAG: DUF501 domain-containing protein [Candidatus Aquicultor secundus]PIY37921.1 MAG: DUF501 domain-containing protein [Candidatus Aquicultor secundus]
MNTTIDGKDMVTVYAQLKRKPRGLKKIASRCAFGCPQVVETHAFIEDAKPFPTLYWLTCPLKVKAVSRMEDDDWAERLRERIAVDSELRERLECAQEDYKLRRRAGTGTDIDKDIDEETSVAGHPVFETGVGGVHNLNAVKCLHAHYAHYLADGNNPIGELVEKELSGSTGLECKEPCDRNENRRD